jgi:CheY-like chemotaxis protein
MAHLGKQVMLIVEDNPMIQDVLQTTLKQINVNFIACMNGQSAVEKCEEFLKEGKMFDIILMDLCMPILDGYGASQQIRLLE